MFDFHFRFPLDIHLGYYGKRSVVEMNKLRDLFQQSQDSVM